MLHKRICKIQNYELIYESNVKRKGIYFYIKTLHIHVKFNLQNEMDKREVYDISVY